MTAKKLDSSRDFDSPAEDDDDVFEEKKKHSGVKHHQRAKRRSIDENNDPSSATKTKQTLDTESDSSEDDIQITEQQSKGKQNAKAPKPKQSLTNKKSVPDKDASDDSESSGKENAPAQDKDTEKRKSIEKIRAKSKDSESSDEEEDASKSRKEKKRRKKSNESKKNKSGSKGISEDSVTLRNLKKYLRLCGIHCGNYAKLFSDCKSMKAKERKLQQMLQDAGMDGRPTLKKCKKLKEAREEAQELKELDTSNILPDNGRRARRACSLPPWERPVQQEQHADSSESESDNGLQNLKGIIDSSESDTNNEIVNDLPLEGKKTVQAPKSQKKPRIVIDSD